MQCKDEIKWILLLYSSKQLKARNQQNTDIYLHVHSIVDLNSY